MAKSRGLRQPFPYRRVFRAGRHAGTEPGNQFNANQFNAKQFNAKQFNANQFMSVILRGIRTCVFD
jgi:hypothetical protein